jgi:cephalosporin hydroxylase
MIRRTKPFSDRLYDKVIQLGLAKPRCQAETSFDDISDAERNSTPVHQAFYGNTGSAVQKWRHYLKIYDRHLAKFRDSPVRFLEIGVSHGGSLRMWRNYLGLKATIFGIDINEECRKYNGEAAQVRIGSQDDPGFLRSVVAEMGGVDVVLDDGSHIARHQEISFDVLFPLINQGLYICEDTHTAYWRGFYEGGYRRRSTFIEKSKRLIDDIHSEFHNFPLSCHHASKSIGAIHFYNSMVVIEKEPQAPAQYLTVPHC